MLWSRTGRLLDAEQAQRLADVRRNNPESETWLALVEAALAESQDTATWDAAVPAPVDRRPARAPLLHGAELGVHRRSASRFVRDLARLAGLDGAAHRLDALDLLQAAVRQDDARIDALAIGDPATLRVVAQVAAVPLLRGCARTIGNEVPAGGAWWEGYCPLCGAWPTLAEFRGLERKRWLRCGRCGIGWEVPWLRCPFCAETSHENLGYLAPEDGETTRKVEVCDTCKGYVKAEPTVSELPWWGVLLDDVATVALDVAALDRGYHRPERPGFALEVNVVARRSRSWWH
ncbi:MAG TPA: formate dehydrogenase accessory protein FdhE [Gemmatimonadales bacterium]|nr:formate dehydrogenase accessory protein FdhE [Gemmatimonadales bacterium]